MSAQISKLSVFAVLAALFTLPFAGCGGGSFDSTTRTGSVAEEAAAAKSPPKSTADEAGNTEPAKVASKHGAEKKKAPSQRKQTSADREGESTKSKGSGADQKSPDSISEQVKELVSGGGSRVVSSPNDVRKILRELKADAKQDGNASGPSSVEKTLEGVLGGN